MERASCLYQLRGDLSSDEASYPEEWASCLVMGASCPDPPELPCTIGSKCVNVLETHQYTKNEKQTNSLKYAIRTIVHLHITIWRIKVPFLWF